MNDNEFEDVMNRIGLWLLKVAMMTLVMVLIIILVNGIVSIVNQKSMSGQTCINCGKKYDISPVVCNDVVVYICKDCATKLLINNNKQIEKIDNNE